MKKSKSIEEQRALILKEVEAGAKVAETRRKKSKSANYAWKSNTLIKGL